MLAAFRKVAKSFVAKVFLVALAVSFVVWGVGDSVKSSLGQHSVASVGNMSISPLELDRHLKSEMQRYQNILGRSLREQELQAYHIKENVLRNLIERKLLDQRIKDLKVMVGDFTIKKQISSNDMFKDAEGKFDKEQFKRILQSNDITEEQFISSMKREFAVGMLTNSLVLNPVASKAQAEALYRYRNEKRIVDIVKVPADYVTSVKEPSETDLIQYYQDNPQEFSVPELKDVVYTTFDLESVKAEIKISDEELRSEYELRRNDYKVPARRDISQYLFNKEDDAKQAYEQLSAGVKISQAAIDMGAVAKDALPEEVQEAAFNTPVGKYSQPQKTAFGWNILYVKDEMPESVRSFDEVKKDLDSEMVESKVSDAFYKFANQIEDAFAEGLALEDVAKKFDLVTHNISAIDANGNGATGKPVADIPNKDAFLKILSESDINADSPLTLLPDNATYIVARVNSVTPSRIRALDEVKGVAIDLWKKNTKATKLKEIALDVAEQLKNGETMAKIAQKMGLEVKKSEVFDRPSGNRESEKSAYPSLLVQEVFKIKKGESSLAYKTDDGGYAVASLKKVREAKTEGEDDSFAEVEQELKQSFIADLKEQYMSFLYKQYPVDINEAAVASFN